MPPNQVATAIKRQWHKLVHAFSRLHVGHRGFYSIERLQALDDYCRDTSLLRVLGVCVMLPLPALLVAICMEFIPLQDPFEGWKANYGLWLRFVVGNLGIGLGFILQMKQLVPGLGLTKLKIVGIAVASTSLGLGFMMTVAILWVFPIPFSLVLVVPPYMTSLVVCFLVGIGRKPFKQNPNLWRDLLKQIYIILAQAMLAVVYPAFGAVYSSLSKHAQAGFVLVLPVMKVIMQNVVAWCSMHLEEYVPGITVFSVELFNALYVAKCMQNASSIFTFVAIMGIDALESVLAFRTMQQKLSSLQELKKQYNLADPKQNLLHAVVEMCQQPGVLAPRKGSFVRLRSPIAFTLSRRNSEILGRLSSISQITARDDEGEESDAPGTKTTVPPSIVSPCSTASNSQVKSVSVMPEAHIPVIAVSKKTNGSGAPHVQQQSDPKQEMTAEQKHELVQQSLKMLFECEYHVLVEYIECMIPLIYATYVAVVCQLPSAQYYPETRGMSAGHVKTMIGNILMYAWMEVVSFIALHFAVKWKFGFSPVYLLAFVLETQALEFQGRLMVWYIFVLELTLEHFGTSTQCNNGDCGNRALICVYCCGYRCGLYVALCLDALT